MLSKTAASVFRRYMTRCLVCITIISLCPDLSRPINAKSISEQDKVIAALIFKLTRFVSWPETQADNITDSFKICLLGNARLVGAIRQLENRKIKEKSVVINFYLQSSAIDKDCRILFIADEKQPFLNEIFDNLKGQSILTLSDMNGFAERGGMIEFKQQNSRVGFVINLRSARKAGLSIASQLLKLATIVDT